jgi:hypothetical protein
MFVRFVGDIGRDGFFQFVPPVIASCRFGDPRSTGVVLFRSRV